MSEKQDREMVEKGLELASRALEALGQAGLIKGFVACVETSQEGVCVVQSCCAEHVAILLDDKISSQSNDPRVREAVEARNASEILALFREDLPPISEISLNTDRNH